MKNIKKNYAVLSCAFILLLLVLALAFVSALGKSGDGTRADKSVKPMSEETVTLIPGENYIIIFSSDTNQIDAEIATQLRTVLRKSGQTPNVKSDILQDEGDFEILIGNTDRELSAQLKAACEAKVKNDSLVWGFAFKDGKFAYAAATDEAFNRGKNEVFERFVTEDSHFVVPSDLWLIVSLSREAYEEELEKAEQERLEAEAAARLERIEALKKEINSFSDSDFTDDVTLADTIMPDTGWGEPHHYPQVGRHPRVGVTSEALAYIREYITTEEGKTLYNKLKALADSGFTGTLSAPYNHTSGRKGFHNWDASDLPKIEAMAFVYLITGDEEYGYMAIRAMKNYLKTYEIGYIYSDQCREFGQILFCIAEVYDWCYDLLSTTDKNQFMLAATDIVTGTAEGTEYEGKCQSGDEWMEVGYPPTLQGSVTGHGSEHQILRDYLSVAIAIFDENPSWYEGVAGRLYNDYIEVRNYYYLSGTYPQGVNNYAGFRHNADLWSAWLLECATGYNPYIDALEFINYSFFSYELPDGSYFGTGDSSRQTAPFSLAVNNSILASALYGNGNMRTRYLDYYSANGKAFSSFSAGSINMGAASIITLSAAYVKRAGTAQGTEVHKDECVVTYHSYPIGQMMARTEWYNENAPAIFMKIGERSTGNHEHSDAGSFQIFYKGLYSGESGDYDVYGSTHFKYYHQATVAHNSLLIFNPDLAEYELDGGSIESSSKENLSKVFYSGGQRLCGTPADLKQWLNTSSYITGSVFGAEYGLKDDGRAEYAYLAGDITDAYSPEQASYVGRRMFTLFTEDESYPMYFLVYDQITAQSESFVKKFLLHTSKEPVIDTDAKTVTVTDNDGRLVLHSLRGGDAFEAIGGEGKNYTINGIQCSLSSTGDDGMWGRVEISNTGSLDGEFLSFMYVTDADNDTKLKPQTLDSERAIGVQIGSDIIMFAKSTDERCADEIVFSTTGSGLQKYYVSGLLDGMWNVEVDGVAVAQKVSTEEGGMISFYAPAGEVHVKPGSNIAPSSGGRIIYNTAGAMLPEGAPQIYELGVPVTLPVPTDGESVFVGWYTSPGFEEDTLIKDRILVHNEKGRLNVYARFHVCSVYEDYQGTSFSVTNTNRSYNGLTYGATGKEGAVFRVAEDKESGNKYLEFIEGTQDPLINADEDVGSYCGIDTVLTFELDLALLEGYDPISSDFRLRESSSAQLCTLFTTSAADGTVKFGGTTLFKLTDEFQRVIVSADFENRKIYAYDIAGNIVGQIALTVPEAASTQDSLEWMRSLKYTFNWHATTGSAYNAGLRIDNVKVYCGSFDPDNVTPPFGQERIVYDAGEGTLPEGTRLLYSAGTPYTLPTPEAEGAKFLGWYTTPDFKEGTEITVIENDTPAAVYVYARYALSVFEQDFKDSSINITDADGNITADGLEYLFSEKTGASAVAVIDEKGNIYIALQTAEGGGEPTVVSYADVASAILSGDGKITFSIALAALANIGGCTDFRLPSPSGSLSIFTTDGGNVYLGGDESLLVATLNSELQTIGFTLDTESSVLTAYTSDGTILASKEVSAPAAFDEWLPTLTAGFEWFFSAGSGIAFDSISVYTGSYTPPIIKNSFDVIYNTGGGKFETTPDATVSNAEDFYLPTDITNGNLVFEGWYYTPECTEDSKVTKAWAGRQDTLVVYAKWSGTIYSEDYTNAQIKADELASASYGNLAFSTLNKDGTSVCTETDENGNTYIKVSATTGLSGDDPAVNASKLSFASVGTGKLTISISLAKGAGENNLWSTFRLRGDGGSANTVEIFTTNNGFVCLNGDDNIPVLELTEKLQNISFTFDVSAATLTAYSASGELLAQTDISVPAASTAKDLAEWVSVLTQPINWQFGTLGELKFDNINVYLGDFVPNTEIVPEGYTKVTFDTNGGVFESEPEPYVPTADAPYTLPTNLTLAGYEFAGWYTSPAFDEGTEITEIPQGKTEEMHLYAKWNESVPDGYVKIEYTTNGGTMGTTPDKYSPIADSDFTLPTDITNGEFTFEGWYTSPTLEADTKIELVPQGSSGVIKVYAKWTGTIHDSSFVYGDVDVDDVGFDTIKNTYFQFNGKSGSTAVTACDPQGNIYVLVKIPTSNPAINSSGTNLHGKAEMNGGKLTYVIDLAAVEGEILASSTFRIRASSASDAVPLFTTLSDGTVMLANKVELTKLTTTLQRIAITLDVYTGALTAYDLYGEVLANTRVSVPDASSCSSLTEWIETTTNLFNWQFNTGGGAIAFNNVHVYLGGYIPKPVPEGSVRVEFVTGGGTFETVPDKYLPAGDAPFTLPVNISRAGYALEGWYTTPDFEEGTKMTEIPQGYEEDLTLYARWIEVTPEGCIKVEYVTNGGEFAIDPGIYAPVADAAFTLPSDLNNGAFTFVGWYTSPSFGEGTEITVIPMGATENVTVYAKWQGTLHLSEFKDGDINADDTGSPTVNSAFFQLMNKTGATAVTEKDASGNTYVAVRLPSSDGAVNSSGTTLKGALAMGGGRITYEIDLSLLGDEPSAYSNFVIRASSSSDTLSLFKTTKEGEVTLGSSKTSILTLTSSLQKIIITLDVYAGKLYAYKSDGTLISETDAIKPSSSSAATLADWIQTTKNLFNWQLYNVSGGSAIGFNNIHVYLGDYIPEAKEYTSNGGTQGTYVHLEQSFDSVDDEDFTEAEGSVGGVSFSPDTGASLKTETDVNGNKYLVFATDSESASSPQLSAASTASFAPEISSVTAEISLGLVSERSALNCTYRMRAQTDEGELDLTLFSVNQDGEVLLGASADHKLCTLTSSDFTDIAISLNFDEGMMLAYVNGSYAMSASFDTAQRGIDWLLKVTEPMYLYAKDTEGALKIDNLRIYSV